MTRLDFSELADFFESACITPSELYNEVCDAMSDLHSIKSKRNSERVDAIWHTLLTCADFLERVVEEEVF